VSERFKVRVGIIGFIRARVRVGSRGFIRVRVKEIKPRN
jgi:hypothetical protein